MKFSEFTTIFITMVLVNSMAAAAEPSTPQTASTVKGRGLDSYLSGIEKRVKTNWFPIRSDRTSRAIVGFKIHFDGSISQLMIETSSGSVFVDDTAIQAVRSSVPLPALPEGAPSVEEARFTFEYKYNPNPIGDGLNPKSDSDAINKVIGELEHKEGDNRKQLEQQYRELGKVYAQKDLCSESLEAFAKARKLCEATHGVGSPQVVDLLNAEVQFLYTDKKNYNPGLALLKQLEEEMPASRFLDRARVKTSIAWLIEIPQQHWDAARSLLKDAADLTRNLKNPILYNRSLFSVAEFNVREHRVDEAIGLLQARFEDCIKASSPQEEGSVDVGEILSDLWFVEKKDAIRSMKVAETLYGTLAAKYGENSPSALDALWLCKKAADRTTDTAMRIKYTEKYWKDSANARLNKWESLSRARPSAENLLFYGICLKDAGKRTEAENAFRSGVKLFPTDTPLKRHLELLVAGGDEKHSNVISLNNNGVRALAKNDFNGAIKNLKEALKLEPTYNNALSNLAIAYNNFALSQVNDPKVALLNFHSSAYLVPGNKTTTENLDGLIRKFLKLDPSSYQTRLKLGDEALAEHDFAGAIVEYSAALSLKNDDGIRTKLKNVPLPGDLPDKKELHLHPQQQQQLELVHRWEERCKAMPSSVEAHLGLSLALVNTGQLDRAEKELRVVLSLDPQNRVATENLSSLRGRQTTQAAPKSDEDDAEEE